MNQSDHCDHFSCPERSVSPAVYILLYVCSAAVVLLTVCGNLLVIISVLHFKQLHTPTNMLLLSLAVSDFLVGALIMPPVFIWTMESCWILGSSFCMYVWSTAGFLMTLSIYNVVLIAFDRCLALLNPFFYLNKVSVTKMCVVIFCNWCMVLGYDLALIHFNGYLIRPEMCPGECFLILDKVLSTIDLVVTFIFPLSVLIILYTRVFVIVKKHVTAIRELNNHTRTKTQKITSHSMKSERKAAKVLGVLVSVFLMCLLPYFIYSLFCDLIELQLELFQKITILFCLNSTINPVIYALFYPWFRRCVKLIITLQIFKTDSELINVFS